VTWGVTCPAAGGEPDTSWVVFVHRVCRRVVGSSEVHFTHVMILVLGYKGSGVHTLFTRIAGGFRAESSLPSVESETSRGASAPLAT
jgi:hypothetical protein